MSVRWEGHQRGVGGLVHACAKGPSEELAAIWSRSRDYGNPHPEDTLRRDVGRNIQAMHRAIRGRREDLDWHVRLASLEMAEGFEGREILSPLYGADNVVAATLAYHTLRDDDPTLARVSLGAAVIRRWLRAKATLCALAAAPQRVTRSTWAQPPAGYEERERGEHWRQGLSVLRAGSRVHRQNSQQEAVSDWLCTVIEWPGWRDRRLEERIDEWSENDEWAQLDFPIRSSGDWTPSYLDPLLAHWHLRSRHPDVLLEEERAALRQVVRGDAAAASHAVEQYLAHVHLHRDFGRIHFLRDERQAGVVIERSASRNKATATVSTAAWSHEGDCWMTTLVPARHAGTGATPARSTLVDGEVTTVADDRYDIKAMHGEIWHYIFSAESAGGIAMRPAPRPEPPSAPKPPPYRPEPAPEPPRHRRGFLRRLWERLFG